MVANMAGKTMGINGGSQLLVAKDAVLTEFDPREKYTPLHKTSAPVVRGTKSFSVSQNEIFANVRSFFNYL